MIASLFQTSVLISSILYPLKLLNVDRQEYVHMRKDAAVEVICEVDKDYEYI